MISVAIPVTSPGQRGRAWRCGLEFREAGGDGFHIRDDAAHVPLEQALTQLGILTESVLPGLNG